MEVQNLPHPNVYDTNSIFLSFSVLYIHYLLFYLLYYSMVFNIVMHFEADSLQSGFSEPGTPTLNPEVTSETNSNFEAEVTPKKKPQFWDIKF